MVVPRVVDVSKWQGFPGAAGFHKAADFGIWGIINKATEGVGYVDPSYAVNRQAIKDAGLLHGAYCFFHPGNAVAQAKYFVDHAKPDADTLMALDWEDMPRQPSSSASVADARLFLETVESLIGRKAVIYSGNSAKQRLGSVVDPWFGAHRLWLAMYASRPICQRSWRTAWLWQYSGDGFGPAPHNAPGIGNNIDMNDYVLDDAITDPVVAKEHLTREWSGDASPEDQKPNAPQTEVPSRNVQWVQTALNSLGFGPLAVDGDYGPLTTAAVRKFQAAHPGLAIDGIAGPMTIGMLEKLTAGGLP